MTLQALYDVPAPAKLNLFLHVVGRRADGYHLLQSPFMLIDWADTLHFERREDGRLFRHDVGASLPTDDLCLRAARALQTASGSTLGADIHIVKQLPTGAGMGGGSSDAATTLLALNRLWGLKWSRQRLSELALGLGADVPFFVGGDNAFVQGIGEELIPIDLLPADYVVIKPAASLPTASIFSHPRLVRDTERVIIAGYLEQAQMLGSIENKSNNKSSSNTGFWKPDHGDFGHNDLQGPAQECCAEVAQVAAWLLQRFGNSRMTGSGSAVFARVDDKSGKNTEQNTGKAKSLVSSNLAEMPRAWVSRHCRSLAQHPLKDWAS